MLSLELEAKSKANTRCTKKQPLNQWTTY